MEALVTLFARVGLTPQRAQETIANKKICSNLETVINSCSSEDIDKPTGALLYHLASNVNQNTLSHIKYLSSAITTKRLLTTDQVSGTLNTITLIQAAVTFVDTNTEINDAQFNTSCGVDVTITPQEISQKIAQLLQESNAELQERKYSMVGSLLVAIKKDLRWANGLLVKEELDKQLLATLGPKEIAQKKKEPKAKQEVQQETVEQRAKSTKLFFEGEMLRLHKPGENPQLRPEIMEDHLKRTKGQMITRFPPEPNGFLHIGHAKAININFGLAAANNGITYLRYDDTNPEAEEPIYFSSILKSIEWLGFTPHAIKYSSDYFQQLYELAVVMIKKDKAYVCHHSADEMRFMRGGDDNKGPRTDSKWRNRPIEESLAEFEKMKRGEYKEGVTTLRMKQDMQDPNPQFWDLVAYRVLYTPHVRTGKQWCIYPTYDYTHCLCDSFEDITHSLCTTEFVMSRESYYWLVDTLEVYRPVQWEYGRLKLTNTVLSKRKLMKLVDEKIVNGWDDPRLFTLEALRRRGFTAPAINAFVRELGVTTSNSTIPLIRLEKCVREHLNETAKRLMVVLDPVKIIITNLAKDFCEEISLPNHPQDVTFGERIVPFTRVIFIDRSDFREVDDENFYRLAPGKMVGLLNLPNPITCTSIIKLDDEITEIHATYNSSTTKPKAYIQWIAESPTHNSPIPIEVRVYGDLFQHADPDNKEQCPQGWFADVNKDSLQVVQGLSECGVRGAELEEKFQFLRVGYFCVDRDSSEEKVVFNRTTGLKEDSKKD